MGTDRRTFLKTSVAALGALSLAGCKTAEETRPGEMPVRVLGGTGYRVKIFSLGGQSTLEEPGNDAAAERIINRAIDLGINYIDTAAAYGNGISETYLGRVMKDRRNEVYLASKTHDRSYDGSMRLLERSLKNLQTDHLDAWQAHNVRTQEDLDRMFADDGAVKAMEQARDEKMVRYVGITGHYDPDVLAEGIRRHPFDTILMALNAADKHYHCFTENLLPLAVEKNMGIIGMKIPGRGRVFREGGVRTMEQAMRYTLTYPVSTIIVGIDTVEHLEENVQIASTFQPMPETELEQIAALTEPYHEEAAWFKHSW